MSSLDEIRKRLEAATPGPWEAENEVDDSGFEKSNKLWIIMQGQPTAYDFDRKEDAELCANAPADIAFLLAEVERLKKDAEIVEKYRQINDRRMINALWAIKDQALPQKGVGKLADKICEIVDEALKNIP